MINKNQMTGNSINKSIKSGFLIILAIFVLFFSITPIKAEAFDFLQIFDPACIVLCGDDEPRPAPAPAPVSAPTPVVTTVPVPISIPVPTPVYTYDYGYNYNYNNSNYSSPLGVNCYSTPTSAGTGDTINWKASAYGGNNYYTYYWSGDDGLNGGGQSINKSYYSSGTKRASVTVTSSGQSISRQCSNDVYINDYNYDNNYPYNYNNHNNNYPYNYNNSNYYGSSLYASCSVNTTFTPVGNYVTWTANVSGGNGYYSYYWNGTDGLSGNQSTITKSYYNPGVKTASLYVNSNGQQSNISCTNSVTVGVPNSGYGVYGGGIVVACFADQTSVNLGNSVTWAVEATGNDNFTYAWTGTDGLTGSGLSVAKTYNTSGEKSAIVTVTSSNGQSASKACGNTVNVRNTSVSSSRISTQTVARQNNTQTDTNTLSAASLFSLKNVPWGLVAILLILILLGMVIYLLINRRKL